MAAKELLTTSFSSGSDVVVTNPCIPCSREDRVVESDKFCVDCNERLCNGCIQLHRRFATTKDHEIVSLSQAGQTEKTSRVSFSETCSKHHGKVLETYCEDHDQLCCSVCVSVSHRACVDVTYLPEAAKGVVDSWELREIKSAIGRLENGLKRLQKKRENDKTTSEKERQAAIKEVKEHRARIIAELDHLEKEFYTQLDIKTKQHSISADEDIRICDKLIRDLEIGTDSISATNNNNEVHIFVNMKRALVKCRESELKFKDIKTKQIDEHFVYKVNTYLENVIKSMSSLGSYEQTRKSGTIKPYHIDILEQGNCSFVGIALLPSGNMVLADESNRIVMINELLKNIKTINLKDKPRDVCVISDTVVCVSHQKNGKLVFVSLNDTETSLKPINVGKICRGVFYKNWELFVACGEGDNAEVRVYSLNGTLIRTIDKDSKGRRLFFRPYYLTTNSDGTRIHVSDNLNGVITTDKQGNVIWVYTGKSQPWGVCIDYSDNLYVCCWESNEIVVISKDGKLIDVGLKETDRSSGPPTSVCYDDISGRLVVTQYRKGLVVFNV